MTRWMNGWLDKLMDDWVAVVPDILGVHKEFLSSIHINEWMNEFINEWVDE